MSPHVDVAHGFDIAFNASDQKSWKKYAKALEAHLKRKSCMREQVGFTLFNREDTFSVQQAEIQITPARCLTSPAVYRNTDKEGNPFVHSV